MTVHLTIPHTSVMHFQGVVKFSNLCNFWIIQKILILIYGCSVKMPEISILGAIIGYSGGFLIIDRSDDS